MKAEEAGAPPPSPWLQLFVLVKRPLLFAPGPTWFKNSRITSSHCQQGDLVGFGFNKS